jgi:DNA-binding transcriptional LysR family regulator
MFSQTLESRHLQTLVEVAAEGSFIGAADTLGVSQAAVSQQMATLERALGIALFDRPGGPRPVTLTAAGRILLGHAELVLAQLEAARLDLEDFASGTRGRLTCGTFQSVSVQLLPEIIARVRGSKPDLAIELVERDENDELIDLLLDGTLDIAFLTGSLDDPRVDTIVLGWDPFLVLLPRQHEFPIAASAKAFPAELLVDIPMVGQQPRALQQEIDDRLRPLGVQPRYAFRTNDNGAVQAMVRAGMGPAVMPRLAIDLDDPDVVILPLEPAVEPRPILVAQRISAQSAPAADDFIDVARKVGRARLLATPGTTQRSR